MTNLQEKYADKIAKLLAKAESTTPAESEALIMKAQELMTQYAIEQTMVDAARGIERDVIETRIVHFIGNQRGELASMCSSLASLNDCMIVQWKSSSLHVPDARKAVKVHSDGYVEVTSHRKAIKYEITGYASDLDRVLMLNTSLQIQAMREMKQWWDTEGKLDHGHDTYAHKVRIKCEFIEAFSDGAYNKLYEAIRVGKQSATQTEAKRTNQSEGEATTSVDLVLRNRRDSVKDFYDKRYGKLRSGRASYKTHLSSGARNAGHAAGRRADVGQSGIRQSRGSLSK